MVRAWAIVAAFAVGSPAIPLRASAAPREVAPAQTSAAVLGLDGEDQVASEALTTALRKAMARRGFVSSASGVTLAELRLASACVDDSPACLAEGAKALDAEMVIYGRLREEGARSRVELIRLWVPTGVLEVQVSIGLTAEELAPDRIDETGDRLVASLLGEPESTPDAPAADPVAEPEAAVVAEPSADEDADRESEYIWGAYSPRPPWKKALLGGSLAVTGVGGLLMLVGFGRRQPLANRVTQAAIDSTTDGVGDGQTTIGSDGLPAVGSVPNDVPNVGGVNPCRVAEHQPQAGSAGVWNKDVASLCRAGEKMATMGNVGVVVFAVGAAASITAITLMFVRRRPARRGARQFGIAPSISGATISGRF